MDTPEIHRHLPEEHRMRSIADQSDLPHEDALAILNSSARLEHKLEAIQQDLLEFVPPIDRIAVVTYDRTTDMLKTYFSSGRQVGLEYYDATLAECTSLARIVKRRHPRVVNDLALFKTSRSTHSRALRDTGFRSSYTVPMYQNEEFVGFIFFNSVRPNVFTPECLRLIDVYAHLIAVLVMSELNSVRLLGAIVRSAHDMVHYRDPEGAGHIDRMARYARLIARHLGASGRHPIDERGVEQILEFAPLHDIGKLAVPERILLKTGELTLEEREHMKRHTTFGLEMIDTLARNLGLEKLEGLDMLRHIIELHHEMLDGSGYPRGLRDGQIPIEARVVAVADIFDALTSERSYKRAWSNADAFAALRRLAHDKLDADCVETLVSHEREVAAIQMRFPGSAACSSC